MENDNDTQKSWDYLKLYVVPIKNKQKTKIIIDFLIISIPKIPIFIELPGSSIQIQSQNPTFQEPSLFRPRFMATFSLQFVKIK